MESIRLSMSDAVRNQIVALVSEAQEVLTAAAEADRESVADKFVTEHRAQFAFVVRHIHEISVGEQRKWLAHLCEILHLFAGGKAACELAFVAYEHMHKLLP